MHCVFHVKIARLRVFLVPAALAALCVTAFGQGLYETPQPKPPSSSNSDSTTIPATRQPPVRNEGHGVETTSGHSPHGSSDGPAIAAGAAATGLIIGALIAHDENTPGHFGKDGPQVPKQLDMNGFVIKGLVHPSWPVVLDFMLDSPGAAQVDIITADNKHHYRAIMTNAPNRRAYGIFHLPSDFGRELQTAFYQVRSMPTAGSNAAPPRLRTFGLGAGDKAVGSVAIDQLTFQPAMIHTKAKELATYAFHAHSAFNAVRAEFVFTTLYNGHLLVEKDQEEKLPPIPEGERGRGTWAGKGKAGEHMLQVRAWRGLENGGDWVVAWSPDIVDVIQQ